MSAPLTYPDTLLSYRGPLSFGTVNELLATIEKRLQQLEESVTIRKRVYNILVECLQNVAHHSATISEDLATTPHRDAEVLVTSEDSAYTIRTTNLVSDTDLKKLKAKLEEVTELTSGQLREHYEQTLVNGSFTQQGTAGLGFIDIARRSGGKLKYGFQSMGTEYSLLNLSITVARVGN